MKNAINSKKLKKSHGRDLTETICGPTERFISFVILSIIHPLKASLYYFSSLWRRYEIRQRMDFSVRSHTGCVFG